MKTLVTYPGNKSRLASDQKNYMPSQPIDVAWECCAGTLAFSANILHGMDLKKIHASELDLGMFSLLKQVQENPYALVSALMDTDYEDEVFNNAQVAEASGFEGLSQLEIAKDKYILCEMSMNGMGEDYRNIDFDVDDDFACWKSGQWFREKYKRRLFSLVGYSKLVQGIDIRHEDMMAVFDLYASRSNTFIYADIPYDNELRSNGIYRVETDYNWHNSFARKLAGMTHSGALRASMMLCGYANTDLSRDRYCKALLPEGWTLYMIKDVYKPTIIREDTKDKQHKGKGVECVFLNYEPINPKVGRDRIFRYSDVF